MTVGRIPQQVATSMLELTNDRMVFLLLVQILFFCLGMVMDGGPALLILMPLLTPVAVKYGIQPVHFGILVEANIAIGMITPPVGLCLFAACATARVPPERVIKPLLPMIGILVVTMLMITYVEGLSMFLPRLLGLVD
jgi:C4-dicarboxylate transporter DctM subunit